MKVSPLPLLRAHRRRAQWIGPLWILSAGLSIGVLLKAWGIPWSTLRWVALATVLLVLLARGLRRVSLRQVGRALDVRLGAENRLEAVAERADIDDALTRAMQTEIAGFLLKQRLPRPYLWWLGWVWLAAAWLALVWIPFPQAGEALGESPAQALPAWASSVEADPAESAPVPELPPPAAALRWSSPEAEEVARGTDVIPLAAEAESATGLQNLSLHVLINGSPQAPQAIAESVGPGPQALSMTLPLATLDVQPADIVAYFLTAERSRPAEYAEAPAWPAVVSPLQVVEVLGAEDDVWPDPALDAEAIELLRRLEALKAAQRRLYREALSLAQAGAVAVGEAALGSGPWLKEEPNVAARVSAASLQPADTADTGQAGADSLQRLQDEQSALAQAVAAARQAAEGSALVSEAATALQEAARAAEEAAASLERADTAAASRAGQENLASLAEAEKALLAAIKERQNQPVAAADQPELSPDEWPERSRTWAGRLEQWAADQAELAAQLANGERRENAFQSQDKLARSLAQQATEKEVPPELKEALQQAAAAATEAASQLNEQDDEAAAEPAQRAALAIKEVLEKIESESCEEGVNLLQQAQRILIRSSNDVLGVAFEELGDQTQAAAQRTRQLRRDLWSAARYYQQFRSGRVAKELRELAIAIQESKVEEELDQIAERGLAKSDRDQRLRVAQTLLELAHMHARAISRMGDEDKIKAQALEEMRRIHASLGEAAKKGSAALRELHERLTACEQCIGGAGHARGSKAPGGPPPPPGPGPDPYWLQNYAQLIGGRIEGLIQQLAPEVREAARTQALLAANPADAPPAYRSAVADYFESLARESTRNRDP